MCLVDSYYDIFLDPVLDTLGAQLFWKPLFSRSIFAWYVKFAKKKNVS